MNLNIKKDEYEKVGYCNGFDADDERDGDGSAVMEGRDAEVCAVHRTA